MSNLIVTTDVGTTAASQPPIGRYRRVPVQVHQADPRAPEVAGRLIALIATRWPATPAEHIGSTAVPGLAGKNTIDLLLAAPPEQIPAITQALGELGFQPQAPAAFLADQQPRRLYQADLDPDRLTGADDRERRVVVEPGLDQDAVVGRSSAIRTRMVMAAPVAGWP